MSLTLGPTFLYLCREGQLSHLGEPAGRVKNGDVEGAVREAMHRVYQGGMYGEFEVLDERNGNTIATGVITRSGAIRYHMHRPYRTDA